MENKNAIAVVILLQVESTNMTPLQGKKKYHQRSFVLFPESQMVIILFFPNGK